jgi:hypothetical protein
MAPLSQELEPPTNPGRFTFGDVDVALVLNHVLAVAGIEDVGEASEGNLIFWNEVGGGGD